MTYSQESTPDETSREPELELEVARLQAEVDTLRGEDPASATSRFLAMAAATVDRVVDDARREAEEIAVEISAQAEARRDEATRTAAEAEEMTDQLLAEADRAQEVIDAANEEAARIKAVAEQEAADLIAAERQKMALEADAFAEVWSTFELERSALQRYHEQLRARVEELADSMVSFMTTELPVGGEAAIGSFHFTQLDTMEEAEEDAAMEDAAVEDAAVEVAEDATVVDDAEDEASPHAAIADDDPWVVMLESAITEGASTEEESTDEESIVDVPDAAIDEIPDGPPSTFGGIPVIEDGDAATDADLFSRARSDDDQVVGFDDLAATADDEELTGLFGTFGTRIVEQTPPEDLAEALEADDLEDKAFRQFIDGDDEPDASRDWLLRPENG